MDECPGIPLVWADDPLAIFTKYPWSRHAIKDNTLGFRFPTANYDGEEITGLYKYTLNYLYGMVKQRRSMLPVPKTYTKGQKPLAPITAAPRTTQLPVSDARPIDAKPSSEEPDYTKP